MIIQLDRSNSVPLYQQIHHQLQQLIVSGALPMGTRLPPERKLSVLLHVNRTTVLAAYRELKADGYVSSHVGQGTVVTLSSALDAENPTAASEIQLQKDNGRPNARDAVIHSDPARWNPLMSQEASRTNDPFTRDMLTMSLKPGMISLAAGIPVPDLESLPALQSLIQSLFEKNGHALFHHTPTEGLPRLRESIAGHVVSRGIQANARDIIVLAGSQQGLDMLARMMLDKGDTVLMEEPTYFCAKQIFTARGATVSGIPLDEEGIRLDVLESWLTHTRPKFLYVMPTYQNPTGKSMSLARRKDLLRLAGRHNLLIVEDDAYAGLRYEGVVLPPLKALDTEDRVAYLGSFSKILFMGLRIGWMHAPAILSRQVVLHRQLSDVHAASLSQWLVDACLISGMLHKHLEESILVGRQRRDLMLESLSRHLSDISGISWERPEGGLYIWLNLPAYMPAHRVAAQAADAGVAVVPGHVCSADGFSSGHALRLNFTCPDEAGIKEGIFRLSDVLHRYPTPSVSEETANQSIQAFPLM